MKHQKHKHWKKTHIAAMVRMRKKGLNNIEIAKEFGCSPESVSLQFHKIKVETGVGIKRGKRHKFTKGELNQLDLGLEKPKGSPNLGLPTGFGQQSKSDAAFEEMKRNAPTLSPEQIKKAREALNSIKAEADIRRAYENARLQASSWKPVATEDPYNKQIEQHIDLFNVIRELNAIAEKLQKSKQDSRPSDKVWELEQFCTALAGKLNRLELTVQALQRAIAGKPVKYSPRRKAKLEIETPDENQ